MLLPKTPACLCQDVVLVAVGYRLGAFGFLCLDLPGAPGNVGLLDQVWTWYTA